MRLLPDPIDRIVVLVAALSCAVALLLVRCNDAQEPVVAPDAVAEAVQAWQEAGYSPCAHEGSVGPCYWDARVRGNGEGRSFLATDDELIYVND